MSGTTLDDLTGVVDETISQNISGADDSLSMDVPAKPKFNFNLSFLGAKSSAEPIENYMNHPLNFKKNSKGLAQIIRGFEGLFGDLNFAIADIFIGYFRFKREGIKENASIGDSDN